MSVDRSDKDLLDWVDKHGPTIWGKAHHSTKKFQAMLGVYMGEEKNTIREAIISLITIAEGK